MKQYALQCERGFAMEFVPSTCSHVSLFKRLLCIALKKKAPCEVYSTVCREICYSRGAYVNG